MQERVVNLENCFFRFNCFNISWKDEIWSGLYLAKIFNQLAPRLGHPEERGPLVSADLILGAQVLHACGALLLNKQVQLSFFLFVLV